MFVNGSQLCAALCCACGKKKYYPPLDGETRITLNRKVPMPFSMGTSASPTRCPRRAVSKGRAFGRSPQGAKLPCPLQGQVPFRRNGITCYTILTMGDFTATLIESAAVKVSRGTAKKRE